MNKVDVTKLGDSLKNVLNKSGPFTNMTSKQVEDFEELARQARAMGQAMRRG